MNFGVPVDEEADEVEVTLSCRNVKGSPAIVTQAAVDFRTRFDKEMCDVFVSAPASEMERLRAMAIASMNIGLPFHEEADELDVIVLYREVKGSPASYIARIDITACLDKKMSDVDMAMMGSEMEGCAEVSVGGIVFADNNHGRCDVIATVNCCWCSQRLCSSIDVCAKATNEQLHKRNMSHLHRAVQG